MTIRLIQRFPDSLSPTRSNAIKVPKLALRAATGAMLALFTPLTLAQTCAAGVQASNPTSVYVIDGAIGTVTDTRTGLMWDRCARGLSGVGCGTGGANAFTGQGALNAAAMIGAYEGFSDWRLPNIKELRSLVEECRIDPSINEFVFPNATASFFWSGSPYAGDATDAWGVFFSFGDAFIWRPQRHVSSSARSRRTVNLPFLSV